MTDYTFATCDQLSEIQAHLLRVVSESQAAMARLDALGRWAPDISAEDRVRCMMARQDAEFACRAAEGALDRLAPTLAAAGEAEGTASLMVGAVAGVIDPATGQECPPF